MGPRKFGRRSFLKASGLAVPGLAWSGCFLPKRQARKHPNILIVMSDDHANHAISAYGSRINQTPNLDRIATEGMRFNHCYCTNAICAPSRATILTGKYSHLNGVIDNRVAFNGAQLTFPKLLKTAGYQTAMIGKWHLRSDPTGFDYWHILPGQGQYYNPDLIEMGNRQRQEGYVTDLITDITLDWLKERDPTRPFCLLSHHKAPHRNWMPGPEHLTLYDDRDIPEPETLFDAYETRSRAAFEQEMSIANHFYEDWDLKLHDPSHSQENIKALWRRAYDRMTASQKAAWDAAYNPKNAAFRRADLSGDRLTQWKYQRYIKDYLRTIASIDDNMGRLLDYLDDTGLSQDTLILYTSDQGFFLGDHGWYDKRFMYEESMGMPLLARLPGTIAPASVNNDLVLNLDFAPTFLDLAGVPIPKGMQGRSLRSILSGHTPDDWPKAVYYHYYEFPASHMVKRHYGIRTQHYKLIHFYNDIDAWELYDLQKDPREVVNLIDNPDYTGVIETLKKELYVLQKKFGDNTVGN